MTTITMQYATSFHSWIHQACNIQHRSRRPCLSSTIKFTQENIQRRAAAHAVGTSPVKWIGSGCTQLFKEDHNTHRGNLPGKGDRYGCTKGFEALRCSKGVNLGHPINAKTKIKIKIKIEYIHNKHNTTKDTRKTHTDIIRRWLSPSPFKDRSDVFSGL